jgi:hypothetical protein
MEIFLKILIAILIVLWIGFLFNVSIMIWGDDIIRAIGRFRIGFFSNPHNDRLFHIRFITKRKIRKLCEESIPKGWKLKNLYLAQAWRERKEVYSVSTWIACPDLGLSVIDKVSYNLKDNSSTIPWGMQGFEELNDKYKNLVGCDICR